jgi:plasmid maintenance system antidote protein VapI
LAVFVAETQKRYEISDRTLCGAADVSPHTLRNLRKGLPISDKSLFQLARATDQLRQETEPVAAVNARWLQKLREFLALAGSQNKLAKLLGVNWPYLGRVLRGEKPITAGMIKKLGAIRI